MKISELQVSSKVSVCLHRLKLSTIRRLTGQDKSKTTRPLHPNNTNLEKSKGYAPEMNMGEDRKVSEERPAANLVQESDAHLLLSLSNNVVIHKKHNKVQQLPEEENYTKDNDASIKTSKTPPSKEIKNKINKAAVIVLDENSDEDKQKNNQSKKIPLENESLQMKITSIKHKLPELVPVERKKYSTSHVVQENTPKNNSKIERKDNETQTRLVSKDDYELLKIIKEKGLTRHQICRLIRRDQESQRGQTEDVNHNSEIPLIDLSLENNPPSNLAQEMLIKLASQSEQNKILIQKIREIVCEHLLKDQSERSANQQINMSNIIPEVFAKTVEECFNKLTQNYPKIMQDMGYSTSEESNKKDEDKSKQQVQNSATNNVGVAEEPMPTIQTHVTQPPMQVQPVQVSPVPDDQLKLPLTQQQMQKQYQLTNGIYPNALMMSALELGRQQLTEPNQQHTNNNWNPSYVRSAMAQQQPFLAAVVNTATNEAYFPPQQASAASNTQAPPTNNQGWQFGNIRAQKNRRLKNTPTRNAPYNAGGPRFPTPSLGKYHIMMERQKSQTMTEGQQKLWEQFQNYPNTAWDNYSYPAFRRTLN